MKLPELEFSRPLTVARIAAKGSHERIEADARECKALAKRFGVLAVHALGGLVLAKPWRGGGVKVTGDVECNLEQISVISLEAFRSTVHFSVERYFLPRHAMSGGEDDVEAIENGEIDLGEVMAETVALELDPYPRAEGEAFAVPGDDKGTLN